MAVVGLERTAYTVSEDVVTVEVCAIVYSPNNSCPINFPFDVRLATEDATAGSHIITQFLDKLVPYESHRTYNFCFNSTIVQCLVKI